MKHLSTQEQEELRALLEAERDSLIEELGTYGVKKGNDWEGASVGEGEEADPLDAADQIEELAINVPLVEELEKRLKDVNDAIIKIEKGTYGICESTGEEIPHKRLVANPAARTIITA